MRKIIGEWSELLVFLKLLHQQNVQIADAMRKPVNDRFFRFHRLNKPLREQGYVKYYLYPTHVQVHDADDLKISCVTQSEIANTIERIASGISGRDSGGGAFEIDSIMPVLTKLGMQDGFVSPSGNKVDVELTRLDDLSQNEITFGYSIKSYQGARATLMNVSAHSAVVGRFRADDVHQLALEINAIDRESSRSWLQNRVHVLLRSSVFEDARVTSDIFRRNLMFIDSQMPRLFASLVFSSFERDSNLLSCLHNSSALDVLKLDVSNREELYHYKVKLLLAEIALGMTPGMHWEGAKRMYGGFLILDESQRVLCIAPQNRNDFEEYLLVNTRFDTPSTKRFPQGSAVVVDGFLEFTLNRQIRFM